MEYIIYIENYVVKMFDRIYQFVYKHRNLIYIVCLLFAGLLMFLWNYFTPFSIIDDTPNMHMYLDVNQPRITSLADIFATQYNFYFTWSGRVLFHSFLELLLLIGKPAISLLCSLTFISIGIMGSKLVSQTNKASKINVLLIIALYYFFSPVWSEVSLWATGFVIYGLPVPLVLCFIYMYLSSFKKAKLEGFFDNYLMYILLGFIVGCSNENVSCALVVLLLVYLLYLNKNKMLQGQHVAGYIALVLGCMLLMLAPGNAERSKVVQEIANTSFVYNVMVRISTFLQVCCDIGVMPILFVFITYLMADKEKLHNTPSYFLVMLGILEMLAILGAPTGFPFRSFVPSMILFVISGIMNLECIKGYEQNKKYVHLVIGFTFLSFIVAAGFYTTFMYINPAPVMY